MHDLLSDLLSSVVNDLVTFKTRKEERFLRQKEVRATVGKYKLPAELAGSSFLLLLVLLIAAALFQSNGCAMTALFLGSLYILALMAGTASLIHLLCRIRRGWNEDDFYLAVAARGNMSPGRLKQLNFFLLIMACTGVVYSAFRLLLPLL